ncbi:MAG TPA: chromate resistance protein ChrB domain-containing protein [Chloroflexota bacterium]|nr:chromate resistance protein ChrB domain-containing protein [Chloroflexota bacterium]
MNYITRERVHVDRIATAWAIRKFIDADATFQFVPRTRDVHGMDGIPFDVRGATLSHRGGRCTFEIFLETYAIEDPGLRRMGHIIHGADLPQDEPSSSLAPGVRAIFDGIRDGCLSDEERLERGFVVCDALYEYCKAGEHSDADE